jgi:hypothetical protein
MKIGWGKGWPLRGVEIRDFQRREDKDVTRGPTTKASKDAEKRIEARLRVEHPSENGWLRKISLMWIVRLAL